MSVHRTETGSWRVRWRDGGRLRSRTFTQRRDARAWDAEVERLRQLGPLGLPQLEKGAITIDEWVATGYADSLASVTDRTRAGYSVLYRAHLAPTFADVPLREVTVEQIAAWQAERQRAGAGAESVRKALMLLGAILQRAVEAGRIPVNPQRNVRKPKPPMKQEKRPLAPATVEVMRRHLLSPEPVGVSGSRPGQRARRRHERERRDPHTCLRDATLVSVLAYAGLRPFEALTLTWGHVQDRTIVVNAPKTGERRSVRMLAPLAADLAAWRLACGHPDDSSLLFPSVSGKVWSQEAYKSWSRRTFDRAAEAAGRPDATPYTLRHSFASLLLREDPDVSYVAEQLGHSKHVTLDTYAHVIAELRGAGRVSAEDVIRAAREGSVPSEFPRAITERTA